MNEQILTKLVIQSSDKDGWLDREKFAELIVQECADLCSDLDGGENMFSRGIRKHFGVE